MALVKSKDTKPEIAVRRLIHRMGYRYRLHSRVLPGHPDLVFPTRKKVIFVHGCFWHRHEGCPNTRLPKSRLDFWKPKLEKNRKRDLAKQRKLRRQGWRMLVVWECQINNEKKLSGRLRAFLEK
jgi:DNA mismatch endonuclease (patch repair protein)